MNFEAFFKVTYGLYIVSAAWEEKKVGYVANTVFQVTAEPPRFAISCSKDNHSVDFIRKGGAFSISVIEKIENADLIGLFGYNSSESVDKFKQIEHFTGQTGAPVVTENCIAWFECELEQEIELDTHVIFIGKLMNSELIDAEKEPLTYSYYRDVKHGMAPKNAPTYIPKEELETTGEEQEQSESGNSYECEVCGYEYDPAIGDPENGIPPGTPFEDLPDDWFCPICGAGKEDFREV